MRGHIHLDGSVHIGQKQADGIALHIDVRERIDDLRNHHRLRHRLRFRLRFRFRHRLRLLRNGKCIDLNHIKFHIDRIISRHEVIHFCLILILVKHEHHIRITHVGEVETVEGLPYLSALNRLKFNDSRIKDTAVRILDHLRLMADDLEDLLLVLDVGC